MAKDDNVNLPSGYGGLVRFKEEYSSFVNLKPVHVIFFLLLLIAFRVGLGFFVKI
ncbi:MAG: preprotein translocase subunit Sec61beta [Candidatus Nanoarchaeia archaeon]|nr:preprotein translocase subunit Sec61beta [Candidatus Nanoarchaeia archaeon]